MGTSPATQSSLEALGLQYRLVTHNLANSNTAGFKRSHAVFEEILAAQAAAAAAGETGSIAAGASVDFTQGPLIRTGRPLDLAINGEGFFVVEDASAPGGQLYTRNGVFRVNDRRQLVDAAGRTVAGTAGPIILPETASPEQLSVSRDGTLSAGGEPIGRLRIVAFEEASVLEPVGASLFRAAADAFPREAANVAVQGGFQEGSNVSTVEELMNLIMVTRLYEANMNTVRAQDERMKSILEVAVS
jgi:flagellar basal body rod protein FlgG